MNTDGIEITHSGTETSGEYVARLPGQDKIGRLIWKARDGNIRVAEHTLVPTEIGGRGVAAKLVEAIVADAREQGFKVDPHCSYVEAKFDRNPDWADIRA